MAVNEIQIRASLAAVNNGSHLRIYELDVNGGIREAQYEGQWTGGTAKNVIGTGKLDTPVAATSIGLTNIRVYYVGTNNTLKESAYDSGSGWYAGALDGKNYAVAPYSSVAAVFLGGKTVLRVYAQVANNTIQEYCWNSDGKGWVTGSNLGPALPGSSIAATTWSNVPNIRVYFQNDTRRIIEKCWDGNGWYDGALSFASTVVRASLAATCWPNGSGISIRVYYSAPGDLILEKGWDSGSWYDGGFKQSSLPASKVAAITLNNSPSLRIYLQNGTSNTAVSEFVWDSGWTPGNPALPPA